MSSNNQRLELIDGLRCFAVLSVVAFHFYYRFGPPLLEPGIYRYDTLPFFKYGGFGVQVFFIISGFVISGSLEQGGGIRSFLLRRYCRLLPAMVLCALVTFIFSLAHVHSPMFQQSTSLNLLFSFTFIHPNIWNLLLNRNDIWFVDGAYWSLWTEVIFYLAAALVYFSFVRKDFLRKWLVVVLGLQVLRALTSPSFTWLLPSAAREALNSVYDLFLFLDLSYWIYFTAGIFFYSLFKRRIPGAFEWMGAGILLALQMFYIKEEGIRYFFAAALVVFSIVVYRPQWVGFLKWRPLVMVGLISYPLYLIHEIVGMLLIDDMGLRLGDERVLGLLPLVTAVMLILFCYLVFVYYERPAIRYLRSKFLPDK